MLYRIWHVLIYVNIYTYVYRGHFGEKFKGVFIICDREL